jgi:hypothetical protein
MLVELVESGEWRMENGEWRMESGEWSGVSPICKSVNFSCLSSAICPADVIKLRGTKP